MLGLQPYLHYLLLGLRFLSLKMGVSTRVLTTSVGMGCKGLGVGTAVAVEGPSGPGGRVSQCPQLLWASCRRASCSCSLFWWLKP